MTIRELMEWPGGYKDPKSTQHYARVNPTRLASAYTHADRTSHLVEVLVDTKTEATGEVPAVLRPGRPRAVQQPGLGHVRVPDGMHQMPVLCAHRACPTDPLTADRQTFLGAGLTE